MELVKQGNEYILKCTYDERLTAKNAGFMWNPTNKYWYTKFAKNASKLVEYANNKLKQELMVVFEETKEKLEKSCAVSADITLPCPESKEYLLYQKAGIAELLNRDNVLLADEMGLGKTIQAIGLINSNQLIQKVLVICPASLKLNWLRECKDWLVTDHQAVIWNGKQELISSEKYIIITNYDSIRKHFDQLMEIKFDLLIVDESHYLKNSQTQRAKLILGYWNKKEKQWINGIVKNCKRKLFLTGTPIPNRPIEIFPVLHCLDPNQFSNPVGFGKRYCAGYEGSFGWDFSGNSHLDELQEKLRLSVMIRRLKKDVLTELPEKLRQMVLIPSEGIKSVKAENALINIDDPDLLYNLGSFQAKFTELSRIRHEQAIEKLPFIIEDIENSFENGIEKLVVFAHHTDVIDTIVNHFPDSVKITGNMDVLDRQKSVNSFQNNPAIKLIVCSIKAAGVGLTLTAGSNVTIAEIDWTPGNNEQAEDRCHRIGQLNCVNVRYIVFDESIDSKIAKFFISKSKVINKALNEEIKFELIQKPEEKQIENKPIEEKKQTEIKEKVIPEYSEEQIQNIFCALKGLTMVCDRACQQDNAGFNKIDTNFGHDLAERNYLTQKQANAAYKMLKKYARQIPEEIYNNIYSK